MKIIVSGTANEKVECTKPYVNVNSKKKEQKQTSEDGVRVHAVLPKYFINLISRYILILF